MNREKHPSLILADTHIIPILLYVWDNEGCTRTDLYLEVARSANTPRKLDMLVSKGLLEQTQVGNGCRLSLTQTGYGVVEKIREIDGLMKKSETETNDN